MEIRGNLSAVSGNFSGRLQATTFQPGSVTQAATSGNYTVDWAYGDLTIITLDGNITFTFINALHGQKHTIKIKQDAAGAHTVTWPATVQWAGGTEPTLITTSGGIDYISFTYDVNDNTHDGLVDSSNGAPTPSIYNLGTIGSGITTVDWSNGYTQKMFLNGSPTLQFINGVVGGVYMLAFTQDASGNRVATWPSGVRWASNIPLSLTTTANRTDYFGFMYDGIYHNGCAVIKNLYE